MLPRSRQVKSNWSRLTVKQKQAKLISMANESELQLKAMLDAHPSTANRYTHQASIAGFFPDFSFPHARLIIELDGACHRGRVAKAADARRTAKLRKKGWRVIRFWNSELRHPQLVMKTILGMIRED